MSDKKEYTVEELLEIAKDPRQFKEKEKSYLSEAHRFAVHFDMKPGSYRVRSAVVYELYKKWKNNSKYQTKTKFFTDFSKIFEKGSTGKFNYYLLDPTPFHLSDDIYDNIKDPITRADVDGRVTRWKRGKEKN